jgi:hypothetical protein
MSKAVVANDVRATATGYTLLAPILWFTKALKVNGWMIPRYHIEFCVRKLSSGNSYVEGLCVRRRFDKKLIGIGIGIFECKISHKIFT